MRNTFAYPGVKHIHELAAIFFSFQLQISPIAHRFLDLWKYNLGTLSAISKNKSVLLSLCHCYLHGIHQSQDLTDLQAHKLFFSFSPNSLSQYSPNVFLCFGGFVCTSAASSIPIISIS